VNSIQNTPTASSTPTASDLQTALNQLAESRDIPRATYRIQFNPDFTFKDAMAIVPYLHELGISHLYASPILQARPGSTHGYDICDYGQLNSALGPDEDFDALVATLHEHDMGLIVDIVPNHMGIGTDCNAWWTDVLENGPSSPYAAYFDISWSPVKPELTDKVLLPVLEDQYGTELESGKIRLSYEGGKFFVQYNAMTLPLTPDTYNLILQQVVDRLVDQQQSAQQESAGEEANPDAEALVELQSIVTALGHLPAYHDQDAEQAAIRGREKEVIKRRLQTLSESSETILQTIQQVLDSINGTPGTSESFDQLDSILAAQPYRIAFWRVAADEINYRRFFDINEMAAIHVEYPEVFNAVHTRILRMIEAGQLDGLRIDHPDGLWDPSTYFRSLQELYLKGRLKGSMPDVLAEDIQQWLDAYLQTENESQRPLPLYIVAEKILSETEPLPLDWVVDGTTGYDFLNQANGIFVQSENEKRMDEIYQRFTGMNTRFADLIYNAKNTIMEKALSSEIRALSHELERITEVSRRYRDFTLSGLTQAIREIIASMSIYRTYITDAETITDRDRRYILEAIINARLRNPSSSRLLFSFIRDTLLLHNLDQFGEANRQRVINFVMKFQQLTGPVMAKSVEDTVFYIYNRLVSINEVGGHPEQFGISVDTFHAQNQARNNDWQHSMLASSTHDTKRSEDVRARINVLSEIPDEWEAALERWSAMNAGKKTLASGQPSPDANDEYLYYQVLLGVWDSPNAIPREDLRDRLAAYMTKAANEAKVHTSWLDQDEEYIASLGQFITQTLEDEAFLSDFSELQCRVAFYGQINALSQTLLKLTSPGVPDIYQGSEGWNLALVDPDNRRPVNFEKFEQQLKELKTASEAENQTAAFITELLDNIDDGRIKQYLTEAVLSLRKQHPDLFQYGSYEPLTVEGEQAAYVCAYLRRYEDQALIVVVPRLVVGLTQGEQLMPLGESVWHDTSLSLPAEMPNQLYRNIFTQEDIQSNDGTLSLANVLRSFLVAILVAKAAEL
jgi:(1->4)-alpha-D-glucan 1-alpha-D-glucosylmutase